MKVYIYHTTYKYINREQLPLTCISFMRNLALSVHRQLNQSINHKHAVLRFFRHGFFCVFKRHHQHQLSEILIALSKVYSLWSSPEEC
jgi:hypothetical protein